MRSRDRGRSFEVAEPPQGWSTYPADRQFHYERLIGYVGTGTAVTKCGDGYLPGFGGDCDESIALPPNSIIVKVSAFNGPPSEVNQVDRYFVGNHPSAARLVVAGLPAVASDLLPGEPDFGAALVRRYTLSRPGYAEGSFVLTAYFGGPDTTQTEEALASMLGTVVLAPPNN